MLPVAVTAAAAGDPVLGVLGEQFPALQWHGDTFGIPAGAVHLARSAAYPNQAFRFGETAYAVQFHVEVTEEMLAEWGHVPAYQKSAEAVLGTLRFRDPGGRVRRWPGFDGTVRVAHVHRLARPGRAGGGPAQHRRPPVTAG